MNLSGDAKVVVRSDDAWRCSRDEADGWRKADFDDRDWAKAKIVAKFGEGPWGHLVNGGARDEFLTPYTADVPGVVRLIYVPRALPITVKRMDRDTRYVASTFDPITGRREEVGPVRPDADGSWKASPPSGSAGDWVLLLEAQGAKP